MSQRIQLLYIRAGDGHVSTAEALMQVLENARPDAIVEMIDILSPDLLGSLDFLGKFFSITGVDIYNLMLRHDLTFLDPLYLSLSRLNIRLLRKPAVSLLSHYWSASKPDLVISLVPLFNGIIADAAKSLKPDTPFLTILTDLCDFPPDYWLVKETQYCLVPTSHAREQAERLSIEPSRLRQSTGLLLRSPFYSSETVDREAERLALGLCPKRPTLLLLFGGNGSPAMNHILHRLQTFPLAIQAICLCGRNETLVSQLRELDLDFPTAIIGYTVDVPCYMRISDLFLGKPGNISVSEAVHMGLPVITVHNKSTLVQERYTGTWLRENGYGTAISSWNEVRSAVYEFLEPQKSSSLHSALTGHTNHALQDAVDWILELVDQDRSSQGTSGQRAFME